jgi:uncharacterized protein YecT (DUF1311 family)
MLGEGDDMRRWYLVGLALVLASSIPAAAQAQFEMNDQAYASLRAAVTEMDSVYLVVQLAYSDSPVFLERLRASQNSWEAFRDAQMEARFPLEAEDNPKFMYGSVYPICKSVVQEELTRLRTGQLRVWADGIEEGDVCLGSVRLAHTLRRAH